MKGVPFPAFDKPVPKTPYDKKVAAYDAAIVKRQKDIANIKGAYGIVSRLIPPEKYFDVNYRKSVFYAKMSEVYNYLFLYMQ